MASEKSLALVLRTIDFSETSLVVTLFTREFGKTGALAKGARRPKGPFESALDLLSICRVVFLRKTSDALDLLTEAKLERRFRPPSTQPNNLNAAYYVAELLSSLTEEDDAHPELFDAATQALGCLAAGLPLGPVVLRLELTALRVVGHMPALLRCAECGNEVIDPGDPPSRVRFGMLDGGLLCPRCRMGKRLVVSVSSEVLVLLDTIATSSMEHVVAIAVPRRLTAELRGLMNKYLAHLIGHMPKLYRYLPAATFAANSED